MVTKDQIVRWLRRVADVLEENKEYLTKLDAAIGDADHGINMDRGFKRVLGQLPKVEDKDIGSILKTTGMALISSVGGAGGPLYGTLFMRAGMAVDGKQELTPEDLVTLLRAAVDGVIQRGKAEVGDKTMVDALVPALQAFQKAVEAGESVDIALERAVAAAEEGMKATIPMLAKKGRASYLGERSIGHQDPGATSSYLILKALLDTVREAP
ncbi:MAG: dihydroxyacetone kinase subunit DhaL [Ardenticatenia bacterium]|nr:dihydroxyacetone kinase subunit DhaL [Ardenticatenia bacterium]